MFPRLQEFVLYGTCLVKIGIRAAWLQDMLRTLIDQRLLVDNTNSNSEGKV